MTGIIRFLPWLVAAAAVFGAGTLFGHTMGKAHSHDLGKKFVRFAFFEAAESRTDKAMLISQIGQERQRSREIIERFEKIAEVTGRARANMLAELRSLKAELIEQEAESREQLQALERELSTDAENWKNNIVPDAITCGVFNGAGCADDRAAGTATGDQGDLEIREPATEGGQ